MSIGERLREERLRLQMSQTDFAALAGASKGAVLKWEKDTSAPTAVALAAFANAGVNVPYVLTGEQDGNRRIGGAQRVLAKIGSKVTNDGSLEPVDDNAINAMFSAGKHGEQAKAFSSFVELLDLHLSSMTKAQGLSIIHDYGVPAEDLLQFAQSISTDTVFEFAKRRAEAAAPS